MAISTGQSWGVLRSWYTGGGQNKDFGAVSQTDLPEFSFVCGAGYYLQEIALTTFCLQILRAAVM